MEGFLRLHMAPWKRVALTRSLAMVPTVAVSAICQLMGLLFGSVFYILISVSSVFDGIIIYFF